MRGLVSIVTVAWLVVFAGCIGAPAPGDARTSSAMASPPTANTSTTPAGPAASTPKTTTWTPTPYDTPRTTTTTFEELKTPSEALLEDEREQLAVSIGDFLYTTTLAAEFPDENVTTWNVNRSTIALASYWNETYGTVDRICYNRSIDQPFLVTTVRNHVDLAGYVPFTVEATYIVTVNSDREWDDTPIARIVGWDDYFDCDVELEDPAV